MSCPIPLRLLTRELGGLTLRSYPLPRTHNPWVVGSSPTRPTLLHLHVLSETLDSATRLTHYLTHELDFAQRPDAAPNPWHHRPHEQDGDRGARPRRRRPHTDSRARRSRYARPGCRMSCSRDHSLACRRGNEVSRYPSPSNYPLAPPLRGWDPHDNDRRPWPMAADTTASPGLPQKGGVALRTPKEAPSPDNGDGASVLSLGCQRETSRTRRSAGHRARCVQRRSAVCGSPGVDASHELDTVPIALGHPDARYGAQGGRPGLLGRLPER